MTGDGHNLFISHAHADAGIADALSRAIEALFERRLSVSYSSKRAEGGIPTGADWFRWIGEEVARSEVTVVLVTPRFVANPAWLLWEAGAVFGTGLAGGEGQRTRVRPLRYRVDGGELPAPLRAANLQMTSGDDAEAMLQFLGELVDDLDVLDRSQARQAGARLHAIVTDYIDEIGPLLQADSAVPEGPPRDADTLEKLLALTIAALQAFSPSAKINGRYFYATREGGRDVLVRDGDVYHETVSMPEEFGLLSVDVERGAETIVICRSFIERSPLYEVLEPDLMTRYPEELHAHISPSQGWVLACPVVIRGAKPLGVICLYGEKPPVRSQNDERRLLSVAVRLSEVFLRAIIGPRVGHERSQ